jgi:hypothetical protein
VRAVAQEYEDNRGNMPDGLQDGNVGTDMQEKADALNKFADSLENAASDSEVTDWEMDTESPEPGEDRDRDDKIQEAIDCAQNALDELSI